MRAIAVYSAAECIAVAIKFGPAIVLMDIGLPGKNGIDLAKEPSEICPGVRIIGVSGFSDRDIVGRAPAAGFSDYLLKPVLPAKLKGAVDPSAQSLATNIRRVYACFARSTSQKTWPDRP
ncbi:MAG: response regulator [Gammaproteobacteria bacterium]